jgi:hypothetical protein
MMRIYLDGQVAVESFTTNRPFANLDPALNPGVGIGNSGGYPGTPYNYPFHGVIDELKLYDGALSEADVLANYNAAKGDFQPSISISDTTATEGSSALKLLDRFVQDDSAALMRLRSSIFGPDGNGDGAQDLYVASGETDEVRRYDGNSGAFIDIFVTAGSGGLDDPGDLAFGPDGSLVVSSLGPAGNRSARERCCATMVRLVPSSIPSSAACHPRLV